MNQPIPAEPEQPPIKEAEPTEQPPCIWREQLDHAFYETGCGNAFSFLYGGPKSNGFKFCPYCGKRIEEKP